MTASEATEVALVRETRSCRACSWFWGPIPPYGPFPTFDFATPFPAEVRRLPQLRQPLGEEKWLDAQGRGAGQIPPAVLHGCRKAPIMTLGINPNMGGFFATPEAARYTYPSFATEAHYAYYYRHRGVTQEVSAQAQPLLPEGRLLAPAAGKTRAVVRSDSHRWLQIELELEGGAVTSLELAWAADRLPVVLARRGAPFQQGEPLAGFLDASAAQGSDGEAGLALNAVPVGYYQRFEPVLRALEARLGCSEPSLRIGEDVSQGDMIACASPGWSRKSFDIPTRRISQNCAGDRRFALRQVLQSQPSVLLFVGNSALSMFADHAPALPWLAAWKARDAFQLLSETTSRATYLDLEDEGVSLHARILCAPHFSYSDNYEPGVRMTLFAWRDFEREHAEDARRLAPHLSWVVTDGETTGVLLRLDPRSPSAPLSEPARAALAPRFMDPVSMLAGALFEEIQRGNLSFDGQRLGRAPGGCRFCTTWSLPGGCAYEHQPGAGVSGAVASNEATLRLARLLGKEAPATGPLTAVRVWLGRRRADITQQQFVEELQRVFVPATVRMMAPLQLVAYLPTLLPAELLPGDARPGEARPGEARPGETSRGETPPGDLGADLPSEVALVFYRSRRAYEDARKTPTGGRYAAMHGSIFQFPGSSSAFAAPWRPERQEQVKERAPCSLLDLPADWQAGTTELRVFRIAPGRESELPAVLEGIRADAPASLRGYIFVREGHYFFRWALFERAALLAGAAEGAALSEPPAIPPIPPIPPIRQEDGMDLVFQSVSTDHALAPEPAPDPEPPVPLQPGTTLNMIFPRLEPA